MSELQIIQDIQNGNTAKFSLLVEKYQTLVFRTVLGFVHVKEDAEDLTQEVFLNAYQSLPKFQGNAEFSTWLYRIAVNLSLNHLNRSKRNLILDLAEEVAHLIFSRESGDKNPQQELEQSERDAAIRRAIDSLPDKQRTAFVLSKYDDLSQKEIAAVMQCSEGSVEQLLQRAKQKLQKKLASFVGK